MILYKLIKNGVETNRWYSTSGLDENHWEPSFGKKERWIASKLDSENVEYVPDEDISQALESREAMDEFENPCMEYKFAAEYQVEIEDITQELQNQAVQDAVKKAIDFGQKVLVQFSSENIQLGITQAGMTKQVRQVMSEVISALSTGSLYDAIDEAKAIPLESKDATFVTDARLLKYVNMVESYLEIPLSESL